MSLERTPIFNNAAVVPRGWMWALPSDELAVSQRKAIEFLGQEIVLYRGVSGKVSAVDAYCPHMGAHLKDGRVVGDSIQCGYHGYRFSPAGECLEAPCVRKTVDLNTVPRLQTYHVHEMYGLIWIHTDLKNASATLDPFPSFQNLSSVKYALDQPEIRNCHFTFILGSGVDEDHFHFVHRKTTALSGGVEFAITRLSKAVIRFQNIAKIPGGGWRSRLLDFVYNGTVIYDVTYWNGTMALARLGFPWLPMYSIFAYRPTPDGRSHAINVYLTPQPTSVIGSLKSRLALSLTKMILRNGGSEDRPFQNSIRLRLGTASKTNPSFDTFVEYVNEQPAIQVRSVRD